MYKASRIIYSCVKKACVVSVRKFVSAHINDNLSVQIDDCIPIQLRYGVLLGEELKYTQLLLTDRKCMILRAVVVVPCFMSSKIVLNVCDKIILPMLLSDIETDCQKYTVFTPMNCTPLRTD